MAVVERVEHHPPFAARLDQAQVAQQPELMRHRRLGHPDERREIADAELAVRERVEHAHARGIAERAERLGQIGDRVFADERRAQLGDAGGVEMNDVAEIGDI